MDKFDVLIFLHFLGVVLIAGGAGVGIAAGEVFQQFDLSETWLWLSYVVWAIAVLLGEGVLARFRHRLHRQAAALDAQGVETSEELQAAASVPTGPVTGVVLTLLLLLFLYVMVFQPGG